MQLRYNGEMMGAPPPLDMLLIKIKIGIFGSLTVFLGFLAKVNSNARHEEKEKGESERD